MKLKIIGWTYYDNSGYPDARNSWAVSNCILDEIAKRNYFFTGEHHQESSFCAPVFNNGKVATLSRRGFAALMAEAHGYVRPYDYAMFTEMMFIRKDKLRIPTESPNASLIVPEEELFEEFVIEVTAEQLAQIEKDGRFDMEDNAELRFVDAGDTIKFVCGQDSVCKKVIDVERDRDLSDEDRAKIYMYYKLTDSERDQLQERIDSKKVVLSLIFVRPKFNASDFSFNKK